MNPKPETGSHVIHAAFDAFSTRSEVVGGFGRSQFPRLGGLDSRAERRRHFCLPGGQSLPCMSGKHRVQGSSEKRLVSHAAEGSSRRCTVLVVIVTRGSQSSVRRGPCTGVEEHASRCDHHEAGVYSRYKQLLRERRWPSQAAGSAAPPLRPTARGCGAEPALCSVPSTAFTQPRGLCGSISGLARPFRREPGRTVPFHPKSPRHIFGTRADTLPLHALRLAASRCTEKRRRGGLTISTLGRVACTCADDAFAPTRSLQGRKRCSSRSPSFDPGGANSPV